jgi:hypothetical protein
VGLAARYLEEAGFSTVVITPTYEFHRAVGIPRSAAIEYHMGGRLARLETGEQEVLKSSLLLKAQKPGEFAPSLYLA